MALSTHVRIVRGAYEKGDGVKGLQPKSVYILLFYEFGFRLSFINKP